ncbi:VOC family protein [Natrinema halophilum]|uniref:VOC family protein n=1 Tax=Natrinema halophilum TaxID=1699371 RepID=A0A7D5KCR4_9EURY|nr:VOC family protein [Natrinema halophilum]QLG48776.1 VOC family protein [Natrinema halophilum]
MATLSAHHVGLTVSDLEGALAFYRDVLDLTVVDRFSVGGEAFSDAVGLEEASADFAHLDADGVRIELVSYDPEAQSVPTTELNQPGAKHVSLSVDDLDAFYASLADDVSTISEPRTTESGTSILFLRDPGGNLIEILES